MAADRVAYRRLVDEYPDLFRNQPGGFEILLDDGAIRQAEAHVAARLRRRGIPPEQAAEWSAVGVTYHDPYLLVIRDAVLFPGDGPREDRLGTYIRAISPGGRPDGVVVLPVRGDRIVLVDHFRHATRGFHWEVPRGFWDGDGSGEENARRELEEEIEAAAVELTFLGSVQPDTGMTASTVQLYLARIETYGRGEQVEGIREVRGVTVAELEAMIRDDVLQDGFTIAAYTRAKLCGLLP